MSAGALCIVFIQYVSLCCYCMKAFIKISSLSNNGVNISTALLVFIRANVAAKGISSNL